MANKGAKYDIRSKLDGLKISRKASRTVLVSFHTNNGASVASLTRFTVTLEKLHERPLPPLVPYPTMAFGIQTEHGYRYSAAAIARANYH